jgi:hypothetical protein
LVGNQETWLPGKSRISLNDLNKNPADLAGFFRVYLILDLEGVLNEKFVLRSRL